MLAYTYIKQGEFALSEKPKPQLQDAHLFPLHGSRTFVRRHVDSVRAYIRQNRRCVFSSCHGRVFGVHMRVFY